MKSYGARGIAALSALGLLAALTATTAAAQTTFICDGLTATIVGTPGNDVLTGTPGDDVIAGLQGNDVISGGGGEDVICGGQGNDVIRGDGGFDIIFGAQGDDLIFSASGTSAALREDTRGARMFGGAGNDTIHGSARWDRMQGGPGADNLFGYEGRDWMRAGADNDNVDGGLGIDDLHGGNGRDTILLTSGDMVRGGAGLDLCNLTSGAPGQIISCGLNERELPRVPVGSFVHQSFGGDTWAGQIDGIVEAEISRFSNVEGRCFLVLGELTPGVISRGVVSSGFTTPELGVIVDGAYHADSSECDTTDADALGYDWILRAEATSGSDIPFYAEIFLPTDVTGPIESILVGDPGSVQVVSVPPLALPGLPVPANLRVGSSVPAEAPVGVAAEFSHSERDNDWVGRVTGIEAAPLSRFGSPVGRCFLVTGEVTPTAIENGNLLSNEFTTPRIGVIVDGRHVDMSGGPCDTADAEARGLGWILDAEVTLNTRYQFYAQILIPELLTGDISHVIVGQLNSDDSFIFSAG